MSAPVLPLCVVLGHPALGRFQPAAGEALQAAKRMQALACWLRCVQAPACWLCSMHVPARAGLGCTWVPAAVCPVEQLTCN